MSALQDLIDAVPPPADQGPSGQTRLADGGTTTLARGLAGIEEIEQELLSTGVADADRRFNLTWHDWLNLRSLCEVSRVIALAALRRENSRGAHFRSDFPEPGDLKTSTFTVARQTPDGIEMTDRPVIFSHVKPGETLLRGAAE